MAQHIQQLAGFSELMAQSVREVDSIPFRFRGTEWETSTEVFREPLHAKVLASYPHSQALPLKATKAGPKPGNEATEVLHWNFCPVLRPKFPLKTGLYFLTK